MAQDLYTLHKEMLKDAGAKELLIAGGHRKYRLPNGHLFVMPSTSVSRRGALNSLAWLRRELKETHPEIAMRGRNLPKEHIEVVNKPGDTPVSITVGPGKPRYDAVYFEAMANIEHIDQSDPRGNFCSMCDAWEIGPPHDHQPKPPIRIEEKEMSSLLERARHALAANREKLTSINEEINQLRIDQQRELENQKKLEAFISAQEYLAGEAEELLGFGVIPPESQPEPIVRRRKASPIHIPFNLVYNTIFPQFRERFNGHGFGPDELRERLKNEGHLFERKQVSNWLGNEVRRPETALVRLKKGRYGFRVNLPSVEYEKYSCEK